jgi:hypothetical protein
MDKGRLIAHYLSGDLKLKNEFYGGSAYRESVISRCERYAGWTIPSVFPMSEITDSEEMQRDYQSVGAQAVTNLSNKMMMALFPPAKPFFRLQLTDEQTAELVADGLNAAAIEEASAEVERAAISKFEQRNGRVVMNDISQQLIITGNSLLYMPPVGKYQSYTIRDYAVKRNLRGDVVKIIIRELIQVSGLPDHQQSLAIAAGYTEESEVELFTGIVRYSNDKFVVWQEMASICYCHEKIGYYSADNLPWVALTWTLARNKDYGSGLVEIYAGDFHTMSTLAEATLDFTTLVTDVKFLVNPSGMTDPKVLNSAASGSYVHGLEGDVFPLVADLRDASNFLTSQFEQVSRRIGAGFLYNTAVVRNAERVTAEEIRMQANELEGSLGGVYSRLALELQKPMATALLRGVDTKFGKIEPLILTGLASLSRNSEVDKLRYFFQDLIPLTDVPPEVAIRIEYGDLIKVLAAGHGVEYKKFLKDEKKVEADKAKAAALNAKAEGMVASEVARAEGTV